MKNKFKEGDVVRITKNSNSHGFEIGQQVKLVRKISNEKGYDVYITESLTDSDDIWYVKTSDIELISDKLEVEPEFVLLAHKAACAEWKKRLEDKFPSVFPDRVVYTIGNKFEYSRNGSTYILARVGTNTFTLVNINTGRQWTKPMKVNSDEGLTQTELKKYLGRDEYRFKLIR